MKKKYAVWILGGIFIIILYGIVDPDKFVFPKCPFRVLTGLLCPGCGSQRAMHQVLHGHFLSSMKLNPLFLPGIVYAFVGAIISNFFPGTWPEVRHSFYGLKAAYLALIIVLVFWVGRNIF
ncbi:MAG: DUF2752 domain-containing protein [Saprospiraceae bacterium]